MTNTCCSWLRRGPPLMRRATERDGMGGLTTSFLRHYCWTKYRSKLLRSERLRKETPSAWMKALNETNRWMLMMMMMMMTTHSPFTWGLLKYRPSFETRSETNYMYTQSIITIHFISHSTVIIDWNPTGINTKSLDKSMECGGLQCSWTDGACSPCFARVCTRVVEVLE